MKILEILHHFIIYIVTPPLKKISNMPNFCRRLQTAKQTIQSLVHLTIFLIRSPSVIQSRPCPLTISPDSPQGQRFMHFCGIMCKDYIFISTDVSELPDFLKLASTDSLVIPSNAPDGIGFPISHLGSAFLAAA